MSNSIVVKELKQGVNHWNDWRRENYVEEPDFSGENFRKINFTGADLNGAIFDKCNLTNTNFTEAILHSASFTNADINQANFTRAVLRHAVLSASINRNNADFTDAIF